MFEVTERPELYDFLVAISGVVLEEDEGVETLRGIIEGERELGRKSMGGGATAVEVML